MTKKIAKENNLIDQVGMEAIPFITWFDDQDTFSKIISIDAEIKENDVVTWTVVATEEITEDLKIRCFWAGAPFKALLSIMGG